MEFWTVSVGSGRCLCRDHVTQSGTLRELTLLPVCVQASTASSDGMLTLDLIQEEDAPNTCTVSRVDLDQPPSHLSPDCPRSRTDGALFTRTPVAGGKSQSLPREAVVAWETPHPGKPLSVAEKNRCVSVDQILLNSGTKPEVQQLPMVAPVNQLQQLIDQKLEVTERLLIEVQGVVEGEEFTGGPRAEAERLLKEAVAAWNQAQEVLEEVKELRELYRQLEPPLNSFNSTNPSPDHKNPE